MTSEAGRTLGRLSAQRERARMGEEAYRESRRERGRLGGIAARGKRKTGRPRKAQPAQDAPQGTPGGTRK